MESACRSELLAQRGRPKRPSRFRLIDGSVDVLFAGQEPREMQGNFLQDGARASRVPNEEPILTELVVDCEAVAPKPKIDPALDRRRKIAIRQSETQTKDMTQQAPRFAALRKTEEVTRAIVHSEVSDVCLLHAF